MIWKIFSRGQTTQSLLFRPLLILKRVELSYNTGIRLNGSIFTLELRQFAGQREYQRGANPAPKKTIDSKVEDDPYLSHVDAIKPAGPFC